MRKMLLLSIWLLSVTRCYHHKILVYSGQEGGLVHIDCPYDSGYETYPKCFLKGVYAFRETLIKTTDKMCKQKTEKRKYDLCDDTEKRILHVTIYNLDLKDTGTYWCEMDAYIYDPIIEIDLKVHKAPAPVKPQPVPLNPPIQTTVEAITMTQQQSARTTVTVDASMTTVGFTTSEDVNTGTYQDTVYATPSIPLQDAHTDINTSSSTANEDQETDGRTSSIFTSSAAQHQDTSRDHKDNIYSNVSVSSESQIQPDSLFYSTVSFNKDTDCSTVTPHSATVTYSTIRHQSTVYCNV
ncbi:CMRF35-like molecule 9 [Thunnus albacares]|uniref:CMRF35-like molecule 9 n=1 Tax=Thunnus albacares TaxID=8236 RepID=UPI001CF71AB0|nr:CMRF35-like molecule 9 [Thunnus albacares]